DSVIEEPHVERIDGSFDHEVIDVSELARYMNRAARDRRGEWRQLGYEQPHVRIERAVVEAKGQLGVGLRRQRDAASPGDRETGRGDVDFTAEILSPNRQSARDLADALGRDKQIVDAESDVVAW